jgi:glutamate---cysteine ligase / carboxylate-amine ligase
MTTAAPVRTFGVEEEFLLVDRTTWRPAPVAQEILADCADARPAGGVQPELTLEQIETVTPVLRDLEDLRASLVGLRRQVALAAERHGAALVASGTSPFPAESHRTPDPRYQEMASAFGITAREQLTCGCHVHVAVESPEEAVGAIDRMRPWLPVLVAIAANSPFWRGADTDYASYRTQVWGRWPSAGAGAAFGSYRAYRECVEAMLASGTILDEGMVYFDVRLSHRYPTVEVRVADVPLEVDDAVLVAVLARALVETSARRWREGRPPPAVRPEVARLATWRASRSGLSAVLVDVTSRRPVPARVMLTKLVGHVQQALDEAGELDTVQGLVADLLGRGTGAARQRDAYRDRGQLDDVVRLLADRTVPLAPVAALR